MKFVPARPGKRVLGAAAATLAVLLGTTGCQVINEQATTKVYSPSDGVIADYGDTKLRNIAFVTDDKDSQARVIGTVANHGDSDVNVTLTIPEGNVQTSVPAGEAVNLEEEELSVSGVSDEPGTLIPVQVQAGGESGELNVPVLSSALAEYSDFVEGDEDTTSHLEHEQRYPDAPGN